MARPRKTFPDYPLRPHSSGQAVIRVRGRGVKYLGRFNSPESRQRYEQLRAEAYLQSVGAPSVSIQQQNATVSHVLTRYLLWAERHYQDDGQPTKQMRRIQAAVAVLNAQYGNRLAKDFGAAQFEELAATLCAEQMCGYCAGAGKRGPRQVACRKCNGSGRRKWARIYVNHLLGCIKTAWDWAVRQSLVASSPLRAVRGVRRGTLGARESAGVRSVPRAAVQATVAQSGPVLADLIELQYLAAMRPEEVCGLRRQDLDTNGVLAAVGRFDGLWIYDVSDDANKNAWRTQGRVVFFGPRAQTILSRYLDRPLAAFIFSPREAALAFLRQSGRKQNWAHGHAPGERYSIDSYERAITRAARRASVPHWTPLQLRHLRATEIRSQYTPDAARVVLGHHLAGVTGRYAENDLLVAAKVMLEIG